MVQLGEPLKLRIEADDSQARPVLERTDAAVASITAKTRTMGTAAEAAHRTSGAAVGEHAKALMTADEKYKALCARIDANNAALRETSVAAKACMPSLKDLAAQTVSMATGWFTATAAATAAQTA